MLLLDLIAALAAASPTPEMIKEHVSYAAVDPAVIYASFGTSISAVFVAALGVWASLINKKKIQEVHVLVNSQFAAYKAAVAEILVLEKEKSRASGEAEGRAKNT